ncbi:hypothetical protein WJX82_004211 [Trebouxia sp. C0006]
MFHGRGYSHDQVRYMRVKTTAYGCRWVQYAAAPSQQTILCQAPAALNDCKKGNGSDHPRRQACGVHAWPGFNSHHSTLYIQGLQVRKWQERPQEANMVAVWVTVALTALQFQDFFGIVMGTFIVAFIGN